MNRSIYSLDTNVVIEMLRQNKAVIRYLDSVVAIEDQLAIPSIVYYEIMRGFKAYNASRRLKQFKDLYDVVVPLPLDEKAIAKAIDIYADLHSANLLIEDADIFIAAITMANDCVLVTDNVKHFGRIDGLKLLDWRGTY